MINLTEKQQTKLKNMIEEHGARKIAVKLIDSYIKRYTGPIGITSLDLPDTATFASGVDEIEDFLSEREYQSAYNTASDIAEEMLAEEGFELPYEE